MEPNPYLLLSDVWKDESPPPAFERRGNNFNCLKDCHIETGSSQGKSLALNDLCVPSLPDSGSRNLMYPDHCFAVMRSTSKEGSYLRLVDFCITQP